MDSDPAAMLIYKILQLNCLAVYWQSDDNLLGVSPPDNWMVCIPNTLPPSTCDASSAIYMYFTHTGAVEG